MLPALLRFHAASGLRVALRGPLPAAVAVTAWLGLQSEPGALIAQAAGGLVGRGGSVVPAAVATGIAFLMSAWAAPRLRAASRGWIRHLPAGSSDHRRAMMAALVAAQAPLLVAMAALVVVAAHAGAIDIARVLALPLISLGAAHLAAPVGPRAARAVAGLAICACGMWGHWAAFGPGLAVMALFDRTRAPFAESDAGAGTWRADGRGQASRARLAWRALGLDAGAPFLVAGACVLAGVAMTVNNALVPPATGPVVRLATVLAAGLSVGLFSASMARGLPVWGWARSLPRSSRSRILEDALLLSLPALAACTAASWLDARAAAAAAACVPWLSVRAAGWMRSTKHGADEWRPAGEGAVLAGVVCLLPWAALASLLAAPFALAWAARREAGIKVTA
ncbi:MAG: hypothetical protein ACREAA_21355 [Candidatus Polarisedimenticolia bacterium]